MADDMFGFDGSDLARLELLYLQAPKKYTRASATVLNNYAFGTRNNVLKWMPTLMTVRNKGFLRSHLRVNKTALSTPIDSQQADVGSIEGPRFSGWIEQETGVRTPRKRVATVRARGGNKRRQMIDKARLIEGRHIMGPEDMGGSSARIKSDHHRAQVFLMWTRRNKPKSFRLWGHNDIPDGLYRWRYNKLTMLQAFDPSVKGTRRVEWMTISRERYFRTHDARTAWAKAIKRVWRL
jgi:hypothetical protein